MILYCKCINSTETFVVTASLSGYLTGKNTAIVADDGTAAETATVDFALVEQSSQSGTDNNGIVGITGRVTDANSGAVKRSMFC